ncbi:MAG: Arm DNA-binding domain-containing protein, partial [Acidobacteria bacterium]|nr:Arm DNA-binding domain-containing protein [Acidobacteriota bacterium]
MDTSGPGLSRPSGGVAELPPKTGGKAAGGRLPDPGRQPGSAPRGRRPEHALSADFVRTVAEPGRYCDGQGLYLEVQPSGSRSWVQRLAVRGRRREMGLGSFPLVSLDEARDQAFANRKLARAGGDPVAARRAADEPTLATAAERGGRPMRAGGGNPPPGRHSR